MGDRERWRLTKIADFREEGRKGGCEGEMVTQRVSLREGYRSI